MSEALENIPNELQPEGTEVTEDAEKPQIKIVDFENFGEIMVGHTNIAATQMTALCLLDDSKVNKFLLASNLKFTDKITGTKIFPREGMSMPAGEAYIEKVKEE